MVLCVKIFTSVNSCDEHWLLIASWELDDICLKSLRKEGNERNDDEVGNRRGCGGSRQADFFELRA
jgi:hypothetical protein